jgi:hypothetical protein
MEHHLSTCPDATNVPNCGKSNNCSLSCLIFWNGHVDVCIKCRDHLNGSCDDIHCKKVKSIMTLRTDLQDFLARNGLKSTGHVYEDVIVKGLNALLQLDFEHIHYIQPRNVKPSWQARYTRLVFEALNCLIDFRFRMLSLGMNIEAGDLTAFLQNGLV